MRRCSLLALLFPALLAGAVLGQTHPNLERGLNAGKAYQVGEIDSVSLFNGNLSVAIPLGQAYRLSEALSYSFVLRYNSNVWDHRLATYTDECQWPYQTITATETTAPEPSSGRTAGLGWLLEFGALDYSGWGQTFDKWTYVSPDGSTHPFYPTLHEGETERAGFRYTRDSSYMRLVANSYSNGGACPAGWLGATVEFADGRSQTFLRSDTCQPFNLTNEADRFGNSLTYIWDYVHGRYVLQDSAGRVHYIGLEFRAGLYPVVSYLDLAAFGGARALYTFDYSDRTVARSCKHFYADGGGSCFGHLWPEVTVPFLTAINQPDGTRWTMLNGTEPGYNLDGKSACASIPQDRPGTLTHLKAPTGGTWNWTYATWSNPVGGTACYSEPAEISHVKDATGVHDRTLTDPFGASSTGLWQYRHDTWRLGDGSVDPDSQESWTTVTTPEGDESRSWFRTKYCGAPQEGWDYGLPYTKGRTGNLAEPWVSSRQYDGSAAVPSNLRRTSSLRYAKDALNAAWEPARLQQSNRRVEFEKTVFEDDPIAGGGGNHYATVERADFDGLGHYRIAMTGGSFGTLRHTTTAYNLGYSYPPATPPAEWWPYTSPWVIGTYPWTRAEEAGVSAKTEACFDAATGYLQRTRTLKASGTSGTDAAQSAADVVVRRTQAGGNTTREEWFGGDTQSVGTGSLFSLTLPATPAYRMDHAYQYGSLRSSRWVGSNGVPLSYYVVDRDLDASTGLVATSRDTAGLATDYAYDAMGRPTWEMPRTTPVNGGGWIQSCYVAASPPATPARVDLYWWPNGMTQPCLTYSGYLKRETVDVDGFGRPYREYRKLFDGSWGQRLTTYNGLGWTASAVKSRSNFPLSSHRNLPPLPV